MYVNMYSVSPQNAWPCTKGGWTMLRDGVNGGEGQRGEKKGDHDAYNFAKNLASGD